MQQQARFLSPQELCNRWGRRITEKTLANWRQQGLGPTPTKIGGRIAYAIEDVIAYEESRRASLDGDAAGG